MDTLLTKKDAIKLIGLDSKTFDNYFRNADEFTSQKRINGKGRFLFSKSLLDKWLTSYEWRTIELTYDDYVLCLDFALAQHFRGYVLSDWGTARQREFGQKITNWIKGQLAEVAVKKFFKREFNADIELDFGIHKNIVPQDIISVSINGSKRLPRVGIGIKASKPKSSYLVLGENEIIISERRSDYYIFCRPDIPDDHLLRLTKEKITKIVSQQPHFDKYKDDIPSFENIFCEISGWCGVDELERVTSIPGQDFTGVRYVKKSGHLHKNKSDWQRLIDKL
ncbi:MAG: hypothetical protein WC596_01900 [Candidatus Shapirobacteria bacterium]